MCIYVYLYCVPIHTRVYLYLYIHIPIYLCVCVYVYMYIYPLSQARCHLTSFRPSSMLGLFKCSLYISYVSLYLSIYLSIFSSARLCLLSRPAAIRVNTNPSLYIDLYIYLSIYLSSHLPACVSSLGRL